ncbi:hypothetical protein [Serratia marcescens]|uniref:hypothetical protein n=1 Tax=Serratia marcescens TaxID=615 RepID=UPI003D6FA851
MFKIIITTEEIINGQSVRFDSAPYYRSYKIYAAAVKNAARMSEIIQVLGSPLKYITNAKVIEVNHA